MHTPFFIMHSSMKKSKILDWAWLAFLILFPLLMLLLPAGYFDEGEAFCPSKRFFDVECLGCGMTRAVMHLIHLDVDSALYYNPGSFLVAPAIAFFWVKWAREAILRLRNTD